MSGIAQGSDVLGRPRNEYLALRHDYKPEHIKLVVIAESPPANGLYFYDASGSVVEPLFRAFMKLLGRTPKDKGEGLRAFREAAWILVDATYEPVNYNKKGKGGDRDATIISFKATNI